MSIAILPIVVVSAVLTWLASGSLSRTLAKATSGLEENTTYARDALAASQEAGMDNIARSLYSMCATQQHAISETLKAQLNSARTSLQASGAVSQSDEKVTWQAVNQFTKQTQETSLPKMLVGKQWLGQNADQATESPIVDGTAELGATCTIFQRMNQAGDMLRVCTNVMKLDGTRAIGTYIPATNPDGTPNAVVSTVLRGETYSGRAFVVNAWYWTSYEPLRDAAGEVIGILYVGVRESDLVAPVRQAVLDTRVGETGYVYVLHAAGNERGVLRHFEGWRSRRRGHLGCQGLRRQPLHPGHLQDGVGVEAGRGWPGPLSVEERRRSGASLQDGQARLLPAA